VQQPRLELLRLGSRRSRFRGGSRGRSGRAGDRLHGAHCSYSGRHDNQPTSLPITSRTPVRLMGAEGSRPRARRRLPGGERRQVLLVEAVAGAPASWRRSHGRSAAGRRVVGPEVAGDAPSRQQNQQPANWAGALATDDPQAPPAGGHGRPHFADASEREPAGGSDASWSSQAGARRCSLETLARRATRPRALIVDQHRRVQAAPERVGDRRSATAARTLNS
jgi:hypothetical protein